MEEMNNNYTPVEPVSQQPIAPEQPTAPEQPQYQQAPPVQPVQPQYQQAPPMQPQYQQAAPVSQPSDAPTPTSILIFGIIGLALSWLPFGSIAGIVLSALGMKKSNAYVLAGAPRSGQAITGRILSRIGLIVSIVMTVIWGIYFTVILIAIATYQPYSYSYYY